MSLAKASLWTAGSTLIKIAVGLLVIKIIALAFGPSGVGLAGNFRQLITVLGVISGAGIFNGVTQSVARYQQQPKQLQQALGTATTLVIACSTLLALLLVIAAEPISHALFASSDYTPVVRVLAFIQLAIAYANLLLAVLKGYRDAAANAISVILGSLLGVAAFMLSVKLGDYSGALIGLALVPAVMLLPAIVLLWLRRRRALSLLLPCWHPQQARHFAKFTLMALITATTLPLAYVMMRHLLATHYGWQQVGIWQGVSSISDAYLQFITASFTVYLLPTLARLQQKTAIVQEITRTLKFVLPLLLVVSFIIWLLRDFAIWLLFSSQFQTMRDLFAWQLLGDVLKISGYVFGYLVIAKAALRFYLLIEISQFSLLLLFSYWLIPQHGALGAAQAYMATYLVHFILCASAFIVYRRRA
ncbi:lipid III flippase WzxE [Serratia microhaemolytica]|uniref:lipid III flippase WzxE n=1 Tax=Serratia microhaemolytica TaxID=2675110 RepID=UPI000FDE8718|nr:lipid III flippase WzxE [Serratia microhaemolytica]